MRRTALAIVREILENRIPDLNQAWLLLDFYSRGTVVRMNASLAQTARTCIAEFCQTLQQLRIVSLGEVRLLTIPFSDTESSDVQIQADFTGFLKRKRTHILLTPPSRLIETQIASHDSQQWATLKISLAPKISIIPKETSNDSPALPLIWQGLRGLARKIVWPHRDARCISCVYTEGCTPIDAHPKRLTNVSARRLVLTRMSKTRKQES